MNQKRWNTPAAVQPKETGLPTRSWWLDAQTREDFDRAAAEQQMRMKISRFGNVRGDLPDAPK